MAQYQKNRTWPLYEPASNSVSHHLSRLFAIPRQWTGFAPHLELQMDGCRARIVEPGRRWDDSAMFQSTRFVILELQRAIRKKTPDLVDANVQDERFRSTSGSQRSPRRATSRQIARLGDPPLATPIPPLRVLFWKIDSVGLEGHPKSACCIHHSKKLQVPIGCFGCCARLEDLKKPCAKRNASLENHRPQKEFPLESQMPRSNCLRRCALGSIAWLPFGWVDLQTNQKRRKSKWNPLPFWAGCWPTNPRQEPDAFSPQKGRLLA